MSAKFSRRMFFKGTAAVGAVLLSRRRARAVEAEILDATIIRGTEHYRGWPTLTRRSNGETLLVCSGGREDHVCPFGRVELQRSQDEGQTWSFPRVVMDEPIDDRDAGVLETANGLILITTFVQLPSGDLLSVRYERMAGSDKAVLRQARWKIS